MDFGGLHNIVKYKNFKDLIFGSKYTYVVPNNTKNLYRVIVGNLNGMINVPVRPYVLLNIEN